MAELKKTAIAPVNIATIKYWGKRDEELILPLNDSISVTLSTEQMHAKTTIMASPNFVKDRIWLNGREESIDNPRLQNVLTAGKELHSHVRKLAKEQNNIGGVHDWKLHICSENNFPTAAGLASSAAGYACLVFTLSLVFNLKGDITAITRQGSGSACRSIFGGFAQWHSGTKSDGSDSIATQIAPANFWPEMHILILVVNDQKKKTGSTVGMLRSLQTSQFLKHRVETCVPIHVEKMIQAIKNRDFELFAEITMKESNQLHSVCLDTYPPAVYMNDISHLIASFVHSYNSFFESTKVAYSFDAGPNACLFLLEKDVQSVLSTIHSIFPSKTNDSNYIRGISTSSELSTGDHKSSNGVYSQSPYEPGLLKYIIHTKVGDGPTELSSGHHLLTNEGIPK